jgi:hypothetical protein
LSVALSALTSHSAFSSRWRSGLASAIAGSPRALKLINSAGKHAAGVYSPERVCFAGARWSAGARGYTFVAV